MDQMQHPSLGLCSCHAASFKFRLSRLESDCVPHGIRVVLKSCGISFSLCLSLCSKSALCMSHFSFVISLFSARFIWQLQKYMHLEQPGTTVMYSY